MGKLNWSAVVKDIAATAAECLASATHGTEIMRELTSAGGKGLSFSKLKDLLKLTPGSMTYELEVLERGGLIENFLERREESKDYSFYRATPIGVTTLNEYEFFLDALERQFVLSSKSPEVQALLEHEDLASALHIDLHIEKYVGVALTNDIFGPYPIGGAKPRGISPKHHSIYSYLAKTRTWGDHEELVVPRPTG